MTIPLWLISISSWIFSPLNEIAFPEISLFASPLLFVVSEFTNISVITWSLVVEGNSFLRMFISSEVNELNSFPPKSTSVADMTFFVLSLP